MAWVKQVEPDKAEGKAREIFDKLKKQLGFVPNTYKMMAVKPEFLQKLLELDEVTFKKGALDTKTKHLMAIAVSAVAGCQYCLAAHAAVAKMMGATDEEIAETLTVAATMGAYNRFNKATGVEVDIKPEFK